MFRMSRKSFSNVRGIRPRRVSPCWRRPTVLPDVAVVEAAVRGLPFMVNVFPDPESPYVRQQALMPARAVSTRGAPTAAIN